jgi:hypothetical protein
MVPLEILVKEAIDIVKLNVEPVQFQHRYRMPEHGLRPGAGHNWSKWSGWKNGRIPSKPIAGWQYEARGLYAL